MLQTIIGNNWPCSYQEKIKNVKLLKHDDGRRLIAKGHLRESGDLKNLLTF